MERKEKSELIDALFDFATEGLIVADKRGKIVLVNPAACRMFGYEASELQGQSIEILVPAHLRGKHEKNRTDYADKPHSRPMGVGMDLHGRKKDGTHFPIEISLSPLEKGEDSLFIAFIIDITVRKSIELSIQEKQTELERVAAVLIATNEELERKVSDRTKVLQEAIRELEKSRSELSQALEKEKDLNDLKSRFISMASHEFRTPLTTILSSASLISEYNKPEHEDKKLKHVNRIRSAVTNLNDILGDFLSISKLEEGKVHADYRHFSLTDLADEVVNELQITSKPGQKIIHQHSGPADVYLDNKMLKNILINLTNNAMKFSPENRNIELNTRVDEYTISVEIKDHGIGISEEDQKHLFERFYRGKNATNIQGTGLGLHIVGNYVDLMKGHIILHSELNVGTTIKITFPNQLNPMQ